MPTTTRGEAVVSIGEAVARRNKDPLQVSCCCCLAASTVQAVSSMTFLLGFALCLTGLFLNQSTSNWELETVEVLGWLCIIIGGFLAVTSLLGLAAARSGTLCLLFSYFMMLLALLASILLACVYAYVENARLTQYVTANWDSIHARLGLGSLVGGEDEALTLDEAIEMLRTYMLALGGVGLTILALLFSAFFAVMRMLGVRAITVCLLLSLGLLGAGTLARALPRALPHTLPHTLPRSHPPHWPFAWSASAYRKAGQMRIGLLTSLGLE